ncbi:MAG TPA: chemotaxis response regulator protein-glutamate methylesterase [Candidatus Limnocylindria bacterium]|nr:chemotaxis response regulator protein-glutamate methylesterase [Candidatus Limnocylindria bacterium]
MTAPGARIRVLVVDDSALVRRIVTDNLARCPDIEVVGTACDPYIAKDKIAKLKPDVLTLDIEMPKMDGITFLKLLMRSHPIPVVVMSSLAHDGSRAAIAALEAGAVDILGKPDGPWSAFDDNQLSNKIRAAAASRPRIRRETEGGIITLPGLAASTVTPARLGTPLIPGVRAGLARSPIVRSTNVSHRAETKSAPRSMPLRSYSANSLILMGASTGGTEALKTVLTHLPAGLPGICIVQHIPARFSTAFAQRLNELCAFAVREAVNGDVVEPGLALVAPGGWHMVLRSKGSHYIVELSDSPPVHHQRPAVDILFDSAIKGNVNRDSIGVLLTGMGSDGARGLKHLRDHGLTTIGQNEETCVVYGMPRAAAEMGAVQHVLPLQDIAHAIIDQYAATAVTPR